jgi:hypothetical protein
MIRRRHFVLIWDEGAEFLENSGAIFLEKIGA